MNDEFDDFTDTDLQQITGGMSPTDAKTVAQVFGALSQWYGSLGMQGLSAAYAACSTGVIWGATHM